ncbi:MAG: hypothetical protein FWF34_00110 [Alphaproteobacteria bacterium]|nr:hypothetical protein [Alphaproteobacteria bacterium]MCL2889653.1 hypothetical protein [Alphaproteobacteria bacterium]
MFNILKKFNGFALAAIGCVLFASASESAIMPQNQTPTARPSIVTSNVMNRMPTLRTTLHGGGGGTTTGGGGTAVTVTDRECIDTYLECARAPEVCGPDFEECTNKNLFFAKRSACTSTLLSCPANGVFQLFGTNNQNILATRSTTEKDENGEFVFVYPTENSILGTMITGASISQRLNTQDCVRRYTQCLKRDDVCGADFELCTSDSEFRKQKVFCASTLARCQSEGRTELWGTTDTTQNPRAPGRLRDMIDEGAALAAVNAVATCYRVADQCFLNACTRNPFLCIEGTNMTLLCNAGVVIDPDNLSAGCTDPTGNIIQQAINARDVRGHIENACFDTIGGNQFCYATTIGNGRMPTASQLRDRDNQADVFADMYATRFTGSTTMRSRINELRDQFDRRTKQRCQDTIVNCAMRNCGEGIGSACYAAAFGNNGNGVTMPVPLRQIKQGCEHIVNNDTSCQYAVATFDTQMGILNFEEESLFDLLFTRADDRDARRPDAVGAVGALNTRLSTSFNQAALDQMKRQCQAVAQSCVRSMCGTDFVNCYRNRTDVMSSVTQSGNAAFDRSMNRVGGVLDHTIIIGLCMNTVKNNQTCEEHIRAEAARRQTDISYELDSWGRNVTDARSGWLAGGIININAQTNTVQNVDADGHPLCTNATGGIGRCDDHSGMFTLPSNIAKTDFVIQEAERSVFAQLIADLEMEAQAKFNAKLTAQQNMCLSGNAAGGIVANDAGTYQWVRLTSGLPRNYGTMGLASTQFRASNEIYNSFCRLRITIQSDDSAIRRKLQEPRTAWGTAYFAVGDSFTCGSWIPNQVLADLSEEVAKAKTGTDASGSLKRGQGWAVAGTSILGAVGGGVGMNALQKNSLGGLLGTRKPVEDKNTASCRSQLESDIRGLVALIPHSFESNYVVRDTIITRSTITGVGEQSVTTFRASHRAGSNVPVQTIISNLTAMGVQVTTGPDPDGTRYYFSWSHEGLLDTKCGASELEDKNKGWRTAVNILGAGIGGTVVGVTTAQIMKSANRAQFSREQEEWMESVGNHIRCYIGAQEVGTFGDIISTEM